MKAIKKIIQKFLSIPYIKNSIDIVSTGFLTVVSYNILTTLLFSLFFLPFIFRELYAVLKGKSAYYSNHRKHLPSRAALRRNIHRLEKGMLMKVRRNIFALEYISETLKLYSYSVQQYQACEHYIDHSELVWAHDVLYEYFDMIEHNELTKKLCKQFFDLPFKKNNCADIKKIPYKRAHGLQENLIEYKDILTLCKYRRSVRWFLEKSVPRELIDKALIVARQAPSACNRLPYVFRIFDDKRLVNEIANIPFGTTGYADNIPVIIVVTGRLDYYFSFRDRHNIYVDSSLAAMSFILALETLGLSSTIINWPDFEPLELKMQKRLKLKCYERPVMLIAVGYADPNEKVAYSEKKDLDTIRAFNFEQ